MMPHAARPGIDPAAQGRVTIVLACPCDRHRRAGLGLLVPRLAPGGAGRSPAGAVTRATRTCGRSPSLRPCFAVRDEAGAVAASPTVLAGESGRRGAADEILWRTAAWDNIRLRSTLRGLDAPSTRPPVRCHVPFRVAAAHPHLGPQPHRSHAYESTRVGRGLHASRPPRTARASLARRPHLHAPPQRPHCSCSTPRPSAESDHRSAVVQVSRRTARLAAGIRATTAAAISTWASRTPTFPARVSTPRPQGGQ